MREMIDNLINGNHTDARKLAKRYSQEKIILFCMDELGWGRRRANAAALWLKTREGYQEYCDAEHEETHEQGK